jgi:hypothetical protein
MAIPLPELQQLLDDAKRNKARGVVNIRFSDGRQMQYVSTPDQWQKIITDLDSEIKAASTGTPAVRFTLPHFSRD